MPYMDFNKQFNKISQKKIFLRKCFLRAVLGLQ